MEISYYAGWISAEPSDIGKLRALGVLGEMRYNYKFKCFEYCSITTDVAKILKEKWKKFWPGCFTAIDKYDNQLPKNQQNLWKED